jgi:fructose/tagatose bisphosphate aldolase
MMSLRDSLAEAARKETAVGHFNVSDLVGLNAIAAAARRLGVPVLIGTQRVSGVSSAFGRSPPSSGADAQVDRLHRTGTVT